MYLARIVIENFRIFGREQDHEHCALELNPGLNLLVGENDSGKSCILDAVRLLIGTCTSDYFAIDPDDFHISARGSVATSLRILGEFRSLTTAEAAAFLEYLTVREVDGRSEFSLRVWLNARLETSASSSPRKRKVQAECKAGPDDEGTRLDSKARDALAAAYLKPLRDAAMELTARRGSRLSQVLRAYPEIEGQEKCDWEPGCNREPSTLVEVMRRAEHGLRGNPVIQTAENELNTEYLGQFSLGPDPMGARITASPHDLRHVLERLELHLSDADARGNHGLGIHNLLFMAAELLAIGNGQEDELPLVLIEEPEAHLEPQRQLRLIEFLLDRAKQKPTSPSSAMQLVLSSHSPNLASRVPLASLTLVHCGRTYSLAPPFTMLEPSDYEFLERFLDVTKANLFFARGVLIVEGDAEALLLPALADLLGRSLTKYGVSIVKVGHIGLFRYSRIFRRRDAQEMPIRVACLADRDIPPDEARAHLPPSRDTESCWSPDRVEARCAALKRNDGGPVLTFISDHWTFEYDIALSGLGEYLHSAMRLAAHSVPSSGEFRRVVRAARQEYRTWRAAMTPNGLATQIYSPFLKGGGPSKAETAQWLARLLRYRQPSGLAGLLPQYLIRAINYATGADESEGAPQCSA